MKYSKYTLIEWLYVGVGIVLILATIELAWQVF